jgi:hypothetical protein
LAAKEADETEEEHEEAVEDVGEIIAAAAPLLLLLLLVRRRRLLPPPPLLLLLRSCGCSVLMDVITEASLGQSVVSVRQQDCCSMLGVRWPAALAAAARPIMARYASLRPGGDVKASSLNAAADGDGGESRPEWHWTLVLLLLLLPLF